MNRRVPARRFIGPTLLFVAVVLFYWKFTLSGQYEWMWSPDHAQQVVPWLNVAARQWHQGTFPWWDPHMWGGQPLLGQAQPGVAYFLNWILFSLPQKNGAFSADILHWYLVTIHYMAALFCYLLCRDLGRSVAASVIAGLVFSLMGYMGATDWPQMMNGAVWAPLVFLFFLRTVENRRPLGSAAMCGLCLGLSWLSGHHQEPLFLTMAAALAWLSYACLGRRVNTRLLTLGVVALVICGMVGALQILPAREYGQLAERWVGLPKPIGWSDKVPYSIHQTYSMTPASLLGIVLPGMATVSEPYVGFAALTLALIGIATRRRDHRVRLFWFLGVGAFLYALGANTVFEGVMYALVPMVEKARTPAAAISLFGFSIAVLAGYGLDALGRRAARTHLRKASRMLYFTGLFLSAALFAFTVAKIGFDQRPALAVGCALLVGALLSAVSSGGLRFRHAAIVAGLLVFVEASNIAPLGGEKRGSRFEFIQRIRSNPDIVKFLRAQPGPFRIELAGDEIPGNWAAYHDLDALTGYLASLSQNINSIAFFRPNIQSLWGVRYSIAKEAVRGEDQQQFAGLSGYKVFARPDAFPRSWVVHRIEYATNRAEVNTFADKDLQSFVNRAFVTSGSPKVEECGTGGSAEYRRSAGDTVVIKASLPCTGMVVTSDTFFPGWKADVDGRATEIYEVNGAMRGVVVPAGLHTVTMRYRPTSVYLGAFLTLLGVLLAVGIVRYEVDGLRTIYGRLRRTPNRQL